MNACQHCGFDKIPEGKLQCPKCGKWQGSDDSAKVVVKHRAVRLSEVKSNDVDRIQTGPWDEIFGTNWKTGERGIARGSVNLIGGLRGCGKSTLFLQICDAVVKQFGRDVLYLSSEEPDEQIKARYDRLGFETGPNILMLSMLTGEAADLEEVMNLYKPVFFLLDSVSALTENMQGQVGICKSIKKFCMRHMVPALISSHVNKGGDIGGLEALQHEVDSVTTFFPEGEGETSPRVLHSEKNRNGIAFINVPLSMTVRGLVPFDPMLGETDEDEDDSEEEDED